MDCDATALTCAVLEVADRLGDGPSWVEVLAQVVVPLVVGVGTLIVAFLSLRVAQRSNAVAEQAKAVAVESHRLSELVRSDALKERLRTERDDFARSLFEWIEMEIAGIQGSERSEAMALTLNVGAQVQSETIDSPNGPELYMRVSNLLHEAKSFAEPPALIVWLQAQTAFAIRTWQRDPEARLVTDPL